MSSRNTSRFPKAMRLLDDGCAQEALQIGNCLLSSADEGDRLSGYLCRGSVYEGGGKDLQPDLEKAMYNFRQAALIAPDAITFCNLARTSMKRDGDIGYSDALKYLKHAADFAMTAEVILGFAHYHRMKPDKDMKCAKRFYLRAAVRGRFRGFFGYSEVARELGQNNRARAVDCIRVVLGPVIALLIGSRAQDAF